MSSSQAQPPPGVDPTKFARRAIGRSPEEHAALERVLAERRRRRGLAEGGSGGSSNSSSRARSRSPRAGPSEDRTDLAQQRRALERREKEFEQQQQREHLLRLEIQEHDLQQRRLRQERQLAAQERELAAARAQAQRVVGGLSEIDVDQALLALPVAQRRAAILAPFGITGGRPRAKGKSKGAGWHKRGYRDDGGYMWINAKEGEECTKGHDVHEGSTLAEFVREVQREYRYAWILSAIINRSLTD